MTSGGGRGRSSHLAKRSALRAPRAVASRRHRPSVPRRAQEARRRSAGPP
ncbi:hypothetical protein ACFPRL_16710 [Pseudoclavibacter helvolus]